MINLHESMGPGKDRTCVPSWICSQTGYRLCYAAQSFIKWMTKCNFPHQSTNMFTPSSIRSILNKIHANYMHDWLCYPLYPSVLSAQQWLLLQNHCYICTHSFTYKTKTGIVAQIGLPACRPLIKAHNKKKSYFSPKTYVVGA